MPSIDIIVPVYNEQDVMHLFEKRIKDVMQSCDIQWRVIFVDDGSNDDSLVVMKSIHESNSQFGYLSLSRNFGKEYAVTAGLDHASSDAAVVIDVDLQDPPELIPEMIAQWHAGYDVVFATRKARHGESVAKKTTANLFYRIINSMSKIDIPKDTVD